MTTSPPSPNSPSPSPDAGTESASRTIQTWVSLTGPKSMSTSDRAMSAALDEEVLGFERAVATAAMVASGCGAAISIVVAVAIAPRLGWPMAAFSCAYWTWFVVLRKRLQRGGLSTPLRLLQQVAEGMIPAGTLLVVAASAGSAYALGSWVPPMLILLTIALSAMRLKPWLPVVTGMASALAYLGLFFFALDHSALPSSALYSPKMQCVRALSIVVTGLMAGYMAKRLHATFSRAAGRLRAKDLFGKYRIGDEIAAGGMGVVHRATYCPDGGFERPVAIKRIHPHLIEDQRVVEAFRAEAEIGARLHHPNIAATLDFGRADDTYFLAMEFVDGEDFSRVLARARRKKMMLSEGTVVAVARAIVSALDYAHTGVRDQSGTPLRVIHRDLSPANILISRRGTVKLSDFGVARALREGERHHTNHLAGKLSYMAPEQARGKDVDERSDLYSLGLILFEALTLVPAQGRETDAETLTVMLEGAPPSVLDRRPDIAPDWEPLFQSLLNRDRLARVESARVLDEKLEAIEQFIAARWESQRDEGPPQADLSLSELIEDGDGSPPPLDAVLESDTRPIRGRSMP